MNKRGMVTIISPAINSGYLLTDADFENLALWKPHTGGAITVCSDDKRYFRARILELSGTWARILVFEAINLPVESGMEIMLLQALPEKERMELIIQKATELGVSSIIPFKSKRSISIDELDARQKKSHRWGDVVLKAARQSRRAVLPEVFPFRSFADAINLASRADIKLLLWENEREMFLKKYLRTTNISNIRSVAVMVGPEGGFEAEEVEMAAQAGFVTVHLGGRILRTETAAITMIGLIQYEFESTTDK